MRAEGGRGRGRTPALLAVLLALVVSFGEAAIAEAPTVTCLNAYGKTPPRTWCDGDFAIATLTPIDRPLGRGNRGILFVRGVATAGGTVTITVTDGARTIGTEVPAAAAADGGALTPAGAFSAEMVVTDLGAHSVRTGAPPDSTDPEDLGKTTLVVTAVAQTASGASAPRTTTVTKLAATPGDVYRPQLILHKTASAGSGDNLYAPTWPPAQWCRGSRLFGQVSMCPLGSPGGQAPCRFLIDNPAVPAHQCNTGEAVVRGLVDDDAFPAVEREETENAYGIASEIADIRVTILQGTRVLREFSQITRISGTKAMWHVLLKISDFEPNFPLQEPYRIVVTIVDAWGNMRSLTSPSFIVYPW